VKDKRTLYFLHIPKTGGMAMSLMMYDQLNANNIPWYPNKRSVLTDSISEIDFNEFVYIQSHLGTFPINRTSNLDVACLVRNPVDRQISNFGWLWMTEVIQEKEEYKDLNSIEAKLKYYLFEDDFYFPHRNLQTRAVCNEPKTYIYKYLFEPESLTDQERVLAEQEKNKLYETNRTRSWYLGNENTSLEFAKSQIDSFKIIGVTDHHNDFSEKIIDWFLENYSTDVRGMNYYRRKDDDVKLFESYLEVEDEVLYCKDLKAMLSEKEIKDIESFNDLDMDLYKYTKNKLGYND
jgi:hypothetical protein